MFMNQGQIFPQDNQFNSIFTYLWSRTNVQSLGACKIFMNENNVNDTSRIEYGCNINGMRRSWIVVRKNSHLGESVTQLNAYNTEEMARGHLPFATCNLNLASNDAGKNIMFLRFCSEILHRYEQKFQQLGIPRS